MHSRLFVFPSMADDHGALVWPAIELSVPTHTLDGFCLVRPRLLTAIADLVRAGPAVPFG